MQRRLPIQLSKIDADSFWSKVDRRGDDECWPWMDTRNARGRGTFTGPRSRQFYASRVAWALANGKDPGDMSVCHRCDNPPCCNPAHLWLGTHEQNMRDMLAKGRRGGPANKIDVPRMLELRAQGMTQAKIAEVFGCNEGNVWKALKRVERAAAKQEGEG